MTSPYSQHSIGTLHRSGSLYSLCRKTKRLSAAVALAVVLLLTGYQTMNAGSPGIPFKADRAFIEHDWGSAQAFYALLLSDNPADSIIGAREIVASYALGDSVLAIETMQSLMNHGVSLDAILGQVRSQSFLAGQSETYVDFMNTARRHCPWIARAIEARMLPYYEFRNDGPQIINYSRRMLAGLPESTRYLHALARGYTLTGDLTQACDIWHKILDIDPTDYPAMLLLGNYYYNSGDKNLADKYLTAAYAIRPTPFVRQRLDSMRPQTDSKKNK